MRFEPIMSNHSETDNTYQTYKYWWFHVGSSLVALILWLTDPDELSMLQLSLVWGCLGGTYFVGWLLERQIAQPAGANRVKRIFNALKIDKDPERLKLFPTFVTVLMILSVGILLLLNYNNTMWLFLGAIFVLGAAIHAWPIYRHIWMTRKSK